MAGLASMVLALSLALSGSSTGDDEEPPPRWSFRNDDKPVKVVLVAGSIGLQVGGQVSEVIFTLMSDAAVAAILDDEFKFGGDLSVAVFHKGAGIEASSSTAFDSDIYAFSKAVGLFGGGAFEGAKLITREKWNQGYYGNDATPRSIVIDRRFSNVQAEDLRNAVP